MNIYEFTHRADCPHGGLKDAYQITVASPATIMVEDIALALKEAPKTIYQEDLADLLRNQLGAEITIVGTHHGVKVTCRRN